MEVRDRARKDFDYICDTWGTLPPEKLTEKIKKSPKDVKMLESRGFAYLLLEDWDKALQDAEEALKIELRSRSLRIKGYSYLKKGQIDDAIRVFGEAAAAASKEKDSETQAWERTLATGLRAIARYLKGDLVEARRDIATAIANAQEDESERYYLYALQGHILAKLGEKDAAIASYRRAFQERPDRASVFMYDNVDLFRAEYVWSEYRKLAR